MTLPPRAPLDDPHAAKSGEAVGMQRRRFFGNLALFAGGVASGSTAVKASQSGAAPTEPVMPLAQVITAKSLGARGDGTGDDGAILTAAIKGLVGTLASRQSTSPIAIHFGDSRFVYNLVTPIMVQQNHIRLLGDGAILMCNGQKNAIVGDHDASANILFGVLMRGFTLKGNISGDAIVIRSGSQCKVEDIRNFAAVEGAIVRLEGTLSSQTRSIKSDGAFGASCGSVIRETTYEKTFGHHFNCIANRHEDFLGYACRGAGIRLSESDAFHLSGDVETCEGPGIDLLNCRFGTVSIYAEANGQGATLHETDTPDDIRIRSGAGVLIARSSNILVTQNACGGAPVQGMAPNNIHIDNADECLVEQNFFGGNIKIESGSRRNNVGLQGRFVGQFTDKGEATISLLTPPRAG